MTTSNQTITNIDKEIIDYYTEFGKSMGLPTTKTGMLYSIVGCERGKKNPLKTIMRELDLIDNKHIPKIYLENSVEVRLELLAGLIDTDGHRTGNTYEIVQKSEKLTDDIVTLAKSLGFYVIVKDKAGYATNTEAKTVRNYKRISIGFNKSSLRIPVKLERKKMTEVTNMYRHKITLTKSEKTFRHEWTDEMKTTLPLIVDTYRFGKAKHVSWAKLVKNEKLFMNLTPDAVRAYFGEFCKE